MKRILIIDDNEDFLEILYTRLAHEGYEVNSLPSGLEILEEISQTRPDLVITDILMPGITGAQVYEEIRRVCGPKLPIIITSATRMKLKKGKDEHLEHCMKPVDFDKLLETVRRFLNLSEQDKDKT